jgi:peptidoglycan/xylan/chitin deacetylase (PgdA/CDA1 family)
MRRASVFRSGRAWVAVLATIVAVVILGGAALHFAGPANALRLLGAVTPSDGSDSSQASDAAHAQKAPEKKADLAPLALYQGDREVAVLMYHDVTDHPSVYFDTNPKAFRKQLQQLKDVGANVVPLADVYEHFKTGTPLPEKAVVLTFDDGYLGHYQNAYPLLKKFNYPATFFVHTGFVGVNTAREHMTWEQLKELDGSGLISVASHTVTHPEDLRKLDDATVEKELNDSKKALEEKLGRKMRFLAYPVGNADDRVARMAQEAGYEMAVTMGPGWATPPADAFLVPRIDFRSLDTVTNRFRTDAQSLTLANTSTVTTLAQTDLESGLVEDRAVRIRYVRGGRMSGLRIMGRKDVPAMVEASGAVAGLNGTFFTDARVDSRGSGIVGPIQTRVGPGFSPGLAGDRERVMGRPFVVWSKDQIAFLPFAPHLATDEQALQRLLPDATDCFLGGAWLVHHGRALTKEQLEEFGLSNIFDFRPRAFIGIDKEGRPFLGAASTGNASDRLAETLEKMELAECVLLDSGFSTSLVIGRAVLVSGIRRDDMPARPVPHFLVLHALDPETKEEKSACDQWGPKEIGPPNVPTLDRLASQLELEQQGNAAYLEAAEPETPVVTHHHRRRHRRRR